MSTSSRNPGSAGTTQLIAMHGWGGDSRTWAPWVSLAEQRGWSVACGERGYGRLPPAMPAWDPACVRRIVIGHSLGPHLLPEAIWREATATVLLAGFAAFVPPGRPGRPLNAALRGMAAQLRAGEAETASMLSDFRTRVADPFPAALLPPGPLQQGIPEEGRQRLLHDLEILAATSGLPAGLPLDRPVLLVEAGDDRIVDAASREGLRQALPEATVWHLERAGHGLLGAADLPAAVLEWIADGPH